MKLTFDDLKPSAEQLKRINELAPGGYGEDDKVAVLPMMVIDEQPTAYFTKPGKSWLQKALAEITGDEGVSLQLNHKIDALPKGRLFDGKMEELDGNTRLYALAYTDQEGVIGEYLGGKVQAVSAGLSYDRLICGICGNEWLSDACIKAAEDKNQLYHWPGREYDGVTCILTFEVDEGDALLEVSLVYKGASKGRLEKPDVAKEFVAALYEGAMAQLDAGGDDDSLDKPAVVRKAGEKIKKRLKRMEIEIGDGEDAIRSGNELAEGSGEQGAEDGGEQGEDEKKVELMGMEKEALVELVGELRGEVAGAAAEKEAAVNEEYQRWTETMLEKDEVVKELSDERVKLAQAKKEMARANEKLESMTGLLADASMKLEGMLEEIENIEGMTLEGKLEIVGEFVALGKGLRQGVAEKIERLQVQAHGNEAGSVEQYMESRKPEELLGAMARAEEEVAKRYKVEPLTAVRDGGKERRTGILRDERAYKTE